MKKDTIRKMLRDSLSYIRVVAVGVVVVLLFINAIKFAVSRVATYQFNQMVTASHEAQTAETRLAPLTPPSHHRHFTPQRVDSSWYGHDREQAEQSGCYIDYCSIDNELLLYSDAESMLTDSLAASEILDGVYHLSPEEMAELMKLMEVNSPSDSLAMQAFLPAPQSSMENSAKHLKLVDTRLIFMLCLAMFAAGFLAAVMLRPDHEQKVAWAIAEAEAAELREEGCYARTIDGDEEISQPEE